MVQRLVSVTLCINSEQISPEFWTGYFGVEPDYLGHKGEALLTPSGRLASGGGRLNSWVVTSHQHVESISLNDHIAYVIERLNLPRADLTSVLTKNLSTLLCFYSWNNGTGEPRPALLTTLLKKLAQSGIKLEDGMTLAQETNP